MAAALEGVVLGLPAIAVSQQSQKREMDFRLGREFDFAVAATFTARLVEKLPDRPLAGGNSPEHQLSGRIRGRAGRSAGDPYGQADLPGQARAHRRGLRQRARKRYRIYGMEPSYHSEDGTDFAAIDADTISVTPLHFDLTDRGACRSSRAGTCRA